MKLRHPTELKLNVIHQRQVGESLKRLVVKFGLPQSTIQGWISGIKISEKAKSRIFERARKQRIIALSKRRTILPSKIYSNPFPPNLVRFFAHCLFDGSIFYDRVVYYSSHKSLAQKFADDGEELFGLKPKWQLTAEGVFRVYLFSRNLSDFLMNRKKFLLENIEEMDQTQRLEFLRAFFDDEGSINYRIESGRRKKRGYQKDVEVLKLIARLLNQLGISSKLENIIRSPELVITGCVNIEKFARLINFRKGVSFLATRKNSYYHETIEKRTVPRQLLASYL